jgi:hypothetical protein
MQSEIIDTDENTKYCPHFAPYLDAKSEQVPVARQINPELVLLVEHSHPIR